MTTAPIRVLIAEDHLIARVGLGTIVETQPDMQVVAEAATGTEAVQLHAQHLPDVRIPVKAVWAEEDQTAWPSVEARYDVIRQGHRELVTRTVPDAGHWVMYEQPHAYNEALKEVLAA